jgi:hypothetical protein
MPERRHFSRRGILRDRSRTVHRMRRPLRRAAVYGGMPGRLYRQGSRASRRQGVVVSEICEVNDGLKGAFALTALCQSG